MRRSCLWVPNLDPKPLDPKRFANVHGRRSWRVFPGPRNSCQSFPDGLVASAEGMQIHEYSYGFGFMPELKMFKTLDPPR